MKLARITLIEGLLAVAIVITILVGVGATGFFVPESKAIKALQTLGFSDIKIVDRSVFLVGLRGGDKSDAVRFRATALNPAGKTVEVYVFSGWLFKGATVRTP